MPFKALFIAHVPDADSRKHRSEIRTDLYELYTVLVKNQSEALEVAREFHQDKQIDSILLCPGFTHAEIAEIENACAGKVGISVARGDGPGTRIAMEAMRRASYPAFQKK